MDNFVVSARKYRPQTFDTVVGQKHITTTLKNAIKNHQLAHAFLFCGPRGVGKTTCARILAKTINCENLQPNGEACDKCPSCVSFNDGASLNIHELDAASNNSVDDIRALVEQVRFAPQAGKYKVYIVDEVHMLSASAFNAFLKTLEEPPGYAIFILATTEKHKILPTILSRCQIFDFKRITNNDTVEHLEEIVENEHLNAEKAALQVIAQKSEGCMRDALSILDKIVSFTDGKLTYQNTIDNLNILDEDYYFKMLECLLQQDLAGLMLLYDEINRKGFEGDMVLNGFAEFIRNLLVCQDSKAASLLDVVEGLQQKYLDFAKKVSASLLVSALNILNEAEINYKQARNKRLHVEMALIKLNFLQQAIELASENGVVIKKKRIDGPVAFREKKIEPLQIIAQPQAPKDTSARLYIAKETPGKTTTKEDVKPIVEEKKTVAQNPLPKAKPQISTRVQSPVSKQTLLDAIKAKVGKEYDVTEVENPEPLELCRLQSTWLAYSDELLQQNKHAAAMTFRAAELMIVDDENFKIFVHTTVQKKQIELERLFVMEKICALFKNRMLNFQIEFSQSDEEPEDVKPVLNSRQRFEIMAEKNPALKLLKDKLKLNIDY
ncbi:DNA polymerase III, subunit gamma and tau [Arachidicoccus ginsenosidimutans]|uniref:DNA polymerase III subunit gamma/tau n=1 Tax=Arachidicoccus sp. BS20 TaxID=1850526 RepID=UPI0007F0F3B4|nr:DNA polymerase III subunit gamma/tau [Arachidicoccus sp. BS20]ANI88163.1 DNA polymerase III, subunit gamma and tau [Arachidicoccus sp. BS20]